MTMHSLANVSVFSLALLASPSLLSAQMADPPQTPEIPMPPGSPGPSAPPIEVPAQPASPEIPPDTTAKMVAMPADPSAYPPCSATRQDQCTNTRPEADVKAVHPAKAPMHRRHHKR
jgi:hypothetical protein